MRTGTFAETVSAASGGSPARARITGATKAWKVKIAEVGKPGSTTTGLPSITARQSGLPGFSATPCTSMPGLPSRETMRCERSPAPFEVPPRQHHHVAATERAAHGVVERLFVVGKGAEGNRFAAGFADGRRDDRAVGVVDAGRLQRLAGRHQFVAGREHGDLRPAHDIDLGDAAGGQHADLARADARAAPQQRLAARDVGAGIGNELSRRERRGEDRLTASSYRRTVRYARSSRRRRRRAASRRRSRSRSPCRGATSKRRRVPAGDDLGD